MFLVLFAQPFYLIDRATVRRASANTWTRTGASYFTVTTFSTVGYGDITARTRRPGYRDYLQMLADLMVIGFGVKMILGAVQTAGVANAAPGQRRARPPASPDAGLTRRPGGTTRPTRSTQPAGWTRCGSGPPGPQRPDVRQEYRQRVGLDDRPHLGRQAEVAAGVHHAELTLGSAPADERAGPFEQGGRAGCRTR